MENSMSDAGAYGLLFLDAITVDVTNLDYVLVIEMIQEIICIISKGYDIRNVTALFVISNIL